jgi:hypothetical protein
MCEGIVQETAPLALHFKTNPRRRQQLGAKKTNFILLFSGILICDSGIVQREDVPNLPAKVLTHTLRQLID